ncbi:MAG: hypothetical protein ACM3JI_00105, partial [Anaerolineae bacterium]
NTLAQMIDNELIFADAEEKELKVSDAEVRETLQERFGPNVMATLEKIGLTYEEARTLIHSEIVVDKMSWYRINSKALQSVNPIDVKLAYKNYLIKNPPIQSWIYEVLSIRVDDDEFGSKIAKEAHKKLMGRKNELKSLSSILPIEGSEQASISVQDYEATDKTISSSHKDVLSSLAEHSFSEPINQISRVDQKAVYRIFFLQKHNKQETPSFENLAHQLRQELIREAVSKEAMQYINKLREHFGYDEKHLEEMVPSDFQPFALNYR